MKDSRRVAGRVAGSPRNRALCAAREDAVIAPDNAVITPDDAAAARSAGTRRGVVDVVLPLPRILEALAAVRHRVRAVLAGWDLPPDLADDALLVVSEMTTNAITHALPPATLRLSRVPGPGQCTLRVQVTDAGPVARSREEGPRGEGSREETGDAPCEEHGRGIAIVAALSVRCGICVRPGEVTRWADLRGA